MDILAAQLFAGVSLAALLLLIALGLTFTFGQMKVVNMAHGEFLMAGAYTAYVVQNLLGTGRAGMSILVSLPVAFLVGGGIGLGLERLLIRHFYGRSLDTLLLTWGVSLMLQQTARVIFGAPNVEVRAPTWLAGGLHIGTLVLPYARLFILALVAVSIAAVWTFLNRLPHGRRMRAVMENRRLAATSGIDTSRIDAGTFFLGSGLAGMAGVALTLIGSIGPTLGANYLIDAFLVVVVGGLGQIKGTVLAALGLGVFNAMVEYETQASLAKVLIFVLIVAFLQLRPQGLVAMRTRALA